VTWRCCGSSRRCSGPVASAPTAWRVLAGIDAEALAGLRAARAAARERAWLARAELRGPGRELPAVAAGGRSWPGLVIDVDATLVTCHSEKESAAATFKGGFGYYPIFAFLDNGAASGVRVRPRHRNCARWSGSTGTRPYHLADLPRCPERQ
jgi:hypothetical protein